MRRVDYKSKLKELELLNLDRRLHSRRKKRLIKERIDDLQSKNSGLQVSLRAFMIYMYNI